MSGVHQMGNYPETETTGPWQPAEIAREKTEYHPSIGKWKQVLFPYREFCALSPYSLNRSTSPRHSNCNPCLADVSVALLTTSPVLLVQPQAQQANFFRELAR